MKIEIEDYVKSSYYLQKFINSIHVNQVPIKKYIDSWDNIEEQKEIKKVLSEKVLGHKFYNKLTLEDVEDIYYFILSKITINRVRTSNYIYENFKLIKYNQEAFVYEVTQNNSKEVIIKAFPSIKKNNFNSREYIEDDISKQLYENNYNVPKRYESFEIEFFRCYPMEKIPFTLEDILEKLDEKKKGLQLYEIVKLLKTCSSILEILHQKYLYIDFSDRNIGIKITKLKELKFYMFDFGGIVDILSKSTPYLITYRYASINNITNEKNNINDDYESLGFLLIDAYFGYFNSPISEKSIVKNKKKIINDSLKGLFGEFFFEYYYIVKYSYHCDIDIINLIEKYEN